MYIAMRYERVYIGTRYFYKHAVYTESIIAIVYWIGLEQSNKWILTFEWPYPARKAIKISSFDRFTLCLLLAFGGLVQRLTLDNDDNDEVDIGNGRAGSGGDGEFSIEGGGCVCMLAVKIPDVFTKHL